VSALSFVCPIALRGTGRDDEDLARLEILLASMATYICRTDLASILLICPPGDMATIQAFVDKTGRGLPLRVISELTVCPEFANDPDTTSRWPTTNRGWFRQQLLKLAIFEHVETTFYLTLDADVVFVRHCSANDLVPHGRALCAVEMAADYRRLYTEEFATEEVARKQIRVNWAERVLKIRRPKGAEHFYGETPVFLHKPTVGHLVEHLQHHRAPDWRSALLRLLPWTEYPLYFTFLEYAGSVDSIYCTGGCNQLLRLDQSLWQSKANYRDERDIDSWDAGEVFDSPGPGGYTVVFQSYLGTPPLKIRAKVGSYIGL
jgi:hypothetical protein